MTCLFHKQRRFLVVCLLLAFSFTGPIGSWTTEAETADNGSPSAWELTAERPLETLSRLHEVKVSDETPGKLLKPEPSANTASLRFDGKTSIAFGPPSDTPGMTTDFTWEGFFLLPEDRKLATETGIRDRLISQFADEAGEYSRLSIGLVDDAQHAQLCVSLEGTDGRTFGRGTIAVEREVWHHFALVHEGTEDAATISWYLDHTLCGQIFLGGQQDPNKLRSPDRAPFTVGARSLSGKTVNRGFHGWIDEVRLLPRVCKVEDFHRVEELPAIGKPGAIRSIAFGIYHLAEGPFTTDFAARAPDETMSCEALALSTLPRAFSPSGFPTRRFIPIGIRGECMLELAPGEHRFLLRTAADAVLKVDGRTVVEAKADVEGKPQEFIAPITSPGGRTRVEVIARLDSKAASGDATVLVAHAAGEGSKFEFIGGEVPLPLTDRTWPAYRGREKRHLVSREADDRSRALDRGEAFWRRRHELARAAAAAWPDELLASPDNPVDAFLSQHNVARPVLLSDAAFLRRLSLDVRGRIPVEEEVRRFLADSRTDKRARLVDELLASDEWADAWMGYWQDALAENPSVVFPTLNNSGAFRHFVHRALRTNMPYDRFATELMLMDGNDAQGGTSGFAIATENDSPAAMKAHVVVKTFLSADLKCARCHDSLIDDYTQEQLFTLAAGLNDGPFAVTASHVAASSPLPGGRESYVATSLKLGQVVVPSWNLTGLLTKSPAPEMVSQLGRPRAEMAAWITSSDSPRFAQVIVNRVWQRWFGPPLVARADHWTGPPSGPQAALLNHLARRFVMDGYDLKKLARVLLTSQAYASVTRPADSGDKLLPWTGPAPRRLSAEQIVDSLFVATGKAFGGERLGVGATDPGAVDLPQPLRAWQFAALPNERDRPALGMPVNQTIVDVLTIFGWNGARQQPQTVREEEVTALQPLLMANGLLSQRVVRLSDTSIVTEMCLKDTTPEQLVERLFHTVLSRPPRPKELAAFTTLIEPGFDTRWTGKPRAAPVPLSDFQPDWKKHLQAEQTQLMMEAQQQVARGEYPTERLTDDFRERVEDALWALINSPEFFYLP